MGGGLAYENWFEAQGKKQWIVRIACPSRSLLSVVQPVDTYHHSHIGVLTLDTLTDALGE